MPSVEDAYQQFRKDVAKAVPGHVIYTKVWGSHSHGCQTPESDVDFLAVYRWDLHDALSLTPPADTVDHKGPDWQAFEIGKFLRLLMKGNAAQVECLWTQYYRDSDDCLLPLFEARDMLINRQTLKQYLGYANGQLQRLQNGTRLHSAGGTYNTKWAYHLVRMMLDAKRIAQDQPPLVMKSGDELALLMSIRRGEWSPEDIVHLFAELDADIKALQPFKIPEKAPETVLDDILFDVRMQEYLGRGNG